MQRSRGSFVTTIVALALAGAAVALALAPGDEASRSPEAAAVRLAREFAGSYPIEARPNGKIIDVEIVAAPAELEMLDGRRLAVWAYNGAVPGPEVRIADASPFAAP
jgi:FtsP/CotA-like multicopper oxidase with cupredoxin domain